ncbi:MAG TPA: cobalt-precorrin-6A reductase [Dongiaceae bacterium]|jgi:precorrin-6A/cobalt-precorrin-6A reductase|nr:cobalt-precorrin-6A reductase [Dongiaceae bacterium]
MRPRLLILGGTGEALALARAVAATMPGLDVTTSLAGRTRDPVMPPGAVRTGGFGGADGLVRYIKENEVGLLVNAAHPFAAEMSAHAVEAHRRTNVPLLRLLRPAWNKQPGDSWIPVADVKAAAEICRWLGKRIFLSLGAKDIGSFAGLSNAHFLVRLVDAPEALPLAHYDLVTARGPFALANERALIAQHGIDLIVTKNSGGEATYAKIVVARELGIPVVMIRRPEIALEPGCDAVESVEAALDWIAGQTVRSRRTGERNATTGEKA